MRGLIAIAFSASMLTACNSSVLTVQDIVSVCHSSTSTEGCEALDETTVSIRGFLFKNETINRPHLLSELTQLDSYDPDEDDYPLSIEMISSQLDFPKYEKFLGQEVVMTGQLYTECPPKLAEKRESMLKQEGNEIMIVGLLTGTCHYVTNPHMIMDSVEIRNIK